MSAGSGRDRHHNGRRKNEEGEPFLVPEISRSPVMRGRRQDSQDDSFLVEDMSGSPKMRGRRQNSQDDHFLVEDMPGSPKMRGRVPRLIPSARNSAADQATAHSKDTSSITNRGLALTSDTIDSPIRMLSTAPQVSLSNNYPTSPTHPRPPDNDDAPPTYESSIPPAQVGWSSEVTSTIPFPLPYFRNQDEDRTANVFTYPPTDAYPPIGLSPFAESYQSIESSRSKSPMRSISPSMSPSPNRLRPAYTYQPLYVERTPSPRPRFPVDNTDGRYVTKPVNQCAIRYTAIIMLFIFIFFLVMLAVVIRFSATN